MYNKSNTQQKGESPKWNGAVLSLILLSFVQGACEFIIIGIIPEIADTFAVPLTQAGMVISYFAIAAVFGICTILSKLFHPGTTFMASACSPTAFNIGVALGTAVGSLTVDTLGLAWTSIPGGIFMSISAFLIWYIMQPERRWLHRLYPS